MENLSKSIVSFEIGGQKLTPDEISEILWIKYDKWFIVGDEIITPKGKHTGKYHNHTAWSIYSKIPNTVEIEEHLESMLDFLDPYVEKIRNLPEVSCEFYCSIAFDTSSGISLDYQKIISRINALWASLDIDLYDITK